MGSSSENIKPIVNIMNEADWMNDTKGKITENPFGGGYYKKSLIQKQYDQDIAVLTGQDINEGLRACKKELINEKYELQMNNIDKLIESERKKHCKKYPELPEETIEEALNNTDSRNITILDNNNSIKGFIVKNKLKFDSNTRFIGSKVLCFAKIFIADFVHSVVKVFHEETIKKHVDDELKRNLIDEVVVMMTLTDTDSASFQFITVCDPLCKMTQKEVDTLLITIIIKELKDKLDLSDPFFDKFNMRTPHTKK